MYNFIKVFFKIIFLIAKTILGGILDFNYKMIKFYATYDLDEIWKK